jgi:hypothetical protein
MVGFLLTFENKEKSPTKVGKNTVLGIFPMLNRKSLLYLLNVLLVGGVMAIAMGALNACFPVVGIGMIKMFYILPQILSIFFGPLLMLGLSTFLTLSIIVTAVEIELVQWFILSTFASAFLFSMPINMDFSVKNVKFRKYPLDKFRTRSILTP